MHINPHNINGSHTFSKKATHTESSTSPLGNISYLWCDVTITYSLHMSLQQYNNIFSTILNEKLEMLASYSRAFLQ